MLTTSQQIVVVGAAGWLGSAICRAIAERGQPLRGILRPGGPRWHIEDLSMTLRALPSPEDGRGWREALADCGAIVIADADLPFLLETERSTAVHRLRSILIAAKDVGCPVLLISHALTCATPSETVPPQGWSEDSRYIPGTARWEPAELLFAREAELYRFVAAGLHAVILNPTALSGPGDVHRTQELLSSPDQDHLISTADVRDIARTIPHALLHGRSGRRYLLGTEPRPASSHSRALPHGVPGSWWETPVDARRARHELGFRPRPHTQSRADEERWARQVGFILERCSS